MQTFWIRVCPCAGLALALLLSAGGCAKTGKVTGKITTSDGQPLPGGTITFTPTEGTVNPASATIKEDGTYEVEAPTGVCKISIDNRSAGQSVSPIGAGGAPTPKESSATGGDTGAPKFGGPGMPKDMMAQIKGATAPPKMGGAGEIQKAMEGKQAPVGPNTPVPGKVVPINSKYYTPESSGLELKVKGGAQTLDIKLE